MAFRGLLPLVSTLLLAAAPAGATHTETIAPPGNSGVEQYLQAVPSAGGSSKPGGGGGVALTPQAKKQLESSDDADAAGLLRLVDQTTAPEVAQAITRERRTENGSTGSGTSSGSGGSGPAGIEASVPSSSGDDGSALSAIGAAFGASGTGPALPAFLLLTAVGAVAVGVRRRAIR